MEGERAIANSLHGMPGRNLMSMLLDRKEING
jgi:hypothetical protein